MENTLLFYAEGNHTSNFFAILLYSVECTYFLQKYSTLSWPMRYTRCYIMCEHIRYIIQSSCVQSQRFQVNKLCSSPKSDPAISHSHTCAGGCYSLSQSLDLRKSQVVQLFPATSLKNRLSKRRPLLTDAETMKWDHRSTLISWYPTHQRRTPPPLACSPLCST